MFLEQMFELRTVLYPHRPESHPLCLGHTTFHFLVNFIILDLVLQPVKLRTCHSSTTCEGRGVLVWCEGEEVRREGRVMYYLQQLQLL